MNYELIGKIDGSVEEFNVLLLSMKGISPIREKMLNLLDSIQQEPCLSIDAKKVLLIYFSLIDDGNARISLNDQELFKKWTTKWNGLVIQAKTKDEIHGIKDSIYFKAEDFSTIIKNGCKDIECRQYSSIIGDEKSPLVIEENAGIKHLYTNKFLEAKHIIEEQIKAVFPPLTGERKTRITSAEVKALSGFDVEAEQLEAINRGQQENLIVTGGPGTGKTTVVLYILWFLLKNNPELILKNIYLAAPSGKAADRMQESIMENLGKLNQEVINSCPENKKIHKVLSDLTSSTLHRLLKYNVSTGKFSYNSQNKFPEDSIFVIDEASMIDISMFAAFLQAIPESGHVFILGDVDQLPSVDAGAVLGELLNADHSYKVTLKVSRRFTQESQIGILARELQTKLPLEKGFGTLKDKPDYWNNIYKNEDDKHPNFVEFIQVEQDDEGKKFTKKQESEKIVSLLSSWVKNVYINQDGKNLSDLAQEIDPTKNFDNVSINEEHTEEKEKREKEEVLRQELWDMTLAGRILAAQRTGSRGVEDLNKAIAKIICNGRKDLPSDGKYFAGQLLILTQNQHMYDLYNGDTGVVVFHEGRPYLMLKKKGRFVFPSLSILPTDAIEPAFAITIHKSQGSEYKHILMFLPTTVGHPLLTNQIAYTGVTRGKKTVTTIATYETFKAASATVTERDTGITL